MSNFAGPPAKPEVCYLNQIRPHWALVPEEGGDPITPDQAYRMHIRVQIPAWQKWAKAAKKKIDAMLDGQGELKIA